MGDQKKGSGFRLSKPEPIREPEEEVKPEPMRPEVIRFAQGMVQASDAASLPGPTADGDLLPRESVSGLFMRDFAVQGAEALGRPPLGEDEAARMVIEKHLSGQSGVYYDANVEADGDDAFLVKLHRLSPNPPFLPSPDVEATYRIDRKLWQIEKA